MLTLPSIAGPAGRPSSNEPAAVDEPTIVMASRLELRRFRDVVPFLVAALRLRRRFRGAPGGMTLGLRAQPLRRRFFTLSSWTDVDALDRFTADELHVDVMTRFRGRMSGSAFVTWSQAGDDVATWDDAIRRLADAPARRAT